jgi:hypothetical protein
MFSEIFAKIVRRIPFYRELRAINEAINQIRADISVIRSVESRWYYNFELENNPRYRDPRRLTRYIFSVNSQNGEDGIIHEIFKRIGTNDCIFTEIGVGNGVQNNSAFLLSQGWRGFWIDGNDDFLSMIDSRKDLQSGRLSTSVSYVDKDNIVGIFKKLEIPAEFDLLSLDIDQNTYYIWEALHEFMPRVVVVEYNANIPPEIDWKVRYDKHRVWDGTQNFGASLKAYELLGNKLGYSLVGCDFAGTNAFFVRNDLVSDKFAEPFTAENHFEHPRYGYVHWHGLRRRSMLDIWQSDKQEM